MNSSSHHGASLKIGCCWWSISAFPSAAGGGRRGLFVGGSNGADRRSNSFSLVPPNQSAIEPGDICPPFGILRPRSDRIIWVYRRRLGGHQGDQSRLELFIHWNRPAARSAFSGLVFKANSV